MLYLTFKSINPATSIGVSNLKYDIYKSTLAKFINHVKDLLDDMSSNYSIVLDKGGIGNVVAPLTIPLTVSNITHLYDFHLTQATEKKIYYRVRGDTISK